MYFLTIIINMFQTFDFAFVECSIGTENKGGKGHPKKIKIMKDVNDDKLVLSSSRVVLKFNKKIKTMNYVNDDELVLSSSRVVLKVNEREKLFYKTMRDIGERTYRRFFHL
jgi:hypothetical protein